MNLITPDNIIRGLALGVNLLKYRIKKIPYAVNYDLTWQCNLRCKHCYFFSSANEVEKIKKKELSDEEWIKIFNYHKNLGIFSCSLTGGEPTLRMNLLYEAVKIFPSVQIASNGIIKLPPFKNSIKEPIYWVSIDGTEQIHNMIRGANIYEKVMNNIQNDKRVLISMTINTINYKDIEDTLKEVYSSGVSGLFFLFHTSYNNDPLLLKGEKLRTAAKNILKVMKDYGDFILISKKMLELYITKEFVPHCILKKNDIISYYPNGKKKFCVMGNSELLCENCGCIVPVASYALSKFDSETVDKLKKFPF
ncbi:MAG: radical SAM protein [Promethearchaeota archaeon]